MAGSVAVIWVVTCGLLTSRTTTCSFPLTELHVSWAGSSTVEMEESFGISTTTFALVSAAFDGREADPKLGATLNLALRMAITSFNVE